MYSPSEKPHEPDLSGLYGLIFGGHDTAQVQAQEGGDTGGGGGDTPPDKCDEYLSKMFGGNGAYFFDNQTHTDDLAMGKDRPNGIDKNGVDQGVHSHLYGSETSISVQTEVYIPPGFIPIVPTVNFANHPVDGQPRNKYIGRENDDGKYLQNRVFFYNANLSETLVIWHIDDYRIEKTTDGSGRTRVGKNGFSDVSGGVIIDSKGNGGHSHFGLYSGYRPSLPLPGIARTKITRRFRGLCPKELQ